MKKRTMLMLALFGLCLAAGAQSLLDNSFYNAGSDLSLQAEAAYESGDYDAAAQTYTLTVVNTKTSGVAYTTSAAGAQTAVSALLPLDFGSWTPTDGGDYRLDVASADASQGTVSGKLYVGDAAKATDLSDLFSVFP